MKALDVRVETRGPGVLYGIWGAASDKNVARDIPQVAKEYYAVAQKKEGNVLPFYVLSKGYDPSTGKFALFIGAEEATEGLQAAQLPGGEYAVVTVRPKLGFLWGPAVGWAKQYVYTRWLPGAGYAARNLEYEYHTEESMGKRPTVEVWFALEKQ